jgi:hypothetical protein
MLVVLVDVGNIISDINCDIIPDVIFDPVL